MSTDSIESDARARWNNDDISELGIWLFERVPHEFRPKWGANILRMVVQRTGTKSDVIERAISIADSPEDWGKGHDAFDNLRDALLKLERRIFRSSKQNLLLSQLALAELVAKVTYNATYPIAAFDEDSGWAIAGQLKQIVDKVNDEDFSSAMWSALYLNEGTPQA